MSWILDKLDILIAKLAIWSIRRGYGADCEMSDLDEFSEEYKIPKDVFRSSRCSSCRAKEVIDWLEEHIKLISL